MFKKIVLLLCLQCCLMMSAVLAEGVTISVAPDVKVDGGVLTLEQLADMNGDEARISNLRQVKLGNAPLPGSSIVLTRELINMRLSAVGFDFSGIVLNIPDMVTVTTRGQTMNGHALIEKATETIKKQIGNTADVSVTPVISAQDMTVPVGNVTLVGSLPYGVRYNTPTPVLVVINVNGQFFSKMILKFDLKWYQPVLVVSSPISQGEVFSSEKLRYERMDIGHLGAGYFTDINKIVGMEARRALTPGVVLLDSMLNKPLLVKRGSIVNIVARIGNMEVTATGQALQDGSEGQLIRVQNNSSTKIISAKVLDAGTVQVVTYKN